jgi:PTH2 family peptidyl-tRNA hydrolase
MAESHGATTAIITTTLVAFISGFALGIYSIRGYIVPPSVTAARRQRLNDPVESAESDIDEDDTILDHAPNWANGAEADRKQGLRIEGEEKSNNVKQRKKKQKEVEDARKEKEEEATRRNTKAESELDPEIARLGAAVPINAGSNPNEECKLVLVVRTDLGMTKGVF